MKYFYLVVLFLCTITNFAQSKLDTAVNNLETNYAQEKVYLLFGIAGKNNTHIELLSNIAVFCSEEENVFKIKDAKTKEEILELLKESFS